MLGNLGVENLRRSIQIHPKAGKVHPIVDTDDIQATALWDFDENFRYLGNPEHYFSIIVATVRLSCLS